MLTLVQNPESTSVPMEQIVTDKARHLYEAARKQKLTADSRRKDSVLLCRSSPSYMTWYSLLDAGLVTPFEGFIMALPPVTVGIKDIPTDTKYSEMATRVQEANQLILRVLNHRPRTFLDMVAKNCISETIIAIAMKLTPY